MKTAREGKIIISLKKQAVCMKVVEAISDMNIGGAGVLLLNRLQHTDLNACPTTVLLPLGSALSARVRALKIPTVEIHGCQDRSLEWHTVWEYCTVLSHLNPDVINCHGCLSCRIAAKWCGIPVRVYTRHCAYPLPKWQTSFWGRKTVGFFQQCLSSHMIAVADAAKQNLTDMGIEAHRICVVINGVNGLKHMTWEERNQIRDSLQIPHHAKVIGICARLEPCKGHTDFLRAAQQLIQRSSDFRFLIIGSGSRERELKDLCHEMRLSPFVHFTGFAEDVAPYFNILDINVNCSVGTETSSLSLSEGMSLGIPAVVSSYGGNPYMIRHGVNGLVYPVGRYDILAQMLYRLSSDPKLYQKLSQGAWERFYFELNAERMTKQTEELYRTWYAQAISKP